MMRDDIIKLVREAGFAMYFAQERANEFERLAALVAAAEREACATIDVTPLKILASDSPGTVILKYRAAIRARGQA